MKIDKKYSRKSIVDNKIYPVQELIRFAKIENSIYFDPDIKLGGRGTYCLNSNEQIEILFKKRLLNKAFKQNINNEVYDKLRKEVSIWQNQKTQNEHQM
ncbi:YlxR family protein [Mycoplasma enhydrae]|uniref:YlxR family protein n=1 Tax=Mycoplasma enhydrae TaxID=2499220 RepID=UPI00197C054E|nr:YlxR family protein [Mycoplasma enhydrae]MBN4089455.1 YlxR family protein [Mycoplasma enhydrae]MCV3733511.1 YlxR family protein [Mycoplasma enhydrae]MCV3753241.1 YlxR family protein [Mycoplasma enhydrae]